MDPAFVFVDIGTPKFAAPQTAPQAPQSSGQLPQLSPLPVLHVPSPQESGRVGPPAAFTVCTPKTQM